MVDHGCWFNRGWSPSVFPERIPLGVPRDVPHVGHKWCSPSVDPRQCPPIESGEM